MRAIYHTEFGVRVALVRITGDAAIVRRIEDGRIFQIAFSELTAIEPEKFYRNNFNRKREEVNNIMNYFTLGPIKGDLGTVVAGELNNLAAPGGDLAKYCAEFKANLEKLGFKIEDKTWAIETGNRKVQIPVTGTVHA